MNQISLRIHAGTEFYAQRRLLIGGSYLQRKIRKIGISQKDQKKSLIKQKNEICGCLRVCQCEEKLKAQKNQQQGQFYEKYFVIRDLNDILSENNQYIEMFDDMYIRKDGILRFNAALSQISFGWQSGQTERIEINTIEGLVNVVRRIKETKMSFQKSIEIFSSFRDNLHEEVSMYITKFLNKISESKQRIGQKINILTTETTEEELAKELEFQRFQFNSFQYLQQISKQKMYSYSIWRLYHQNEEAEILHQGYSKPYLNLLGLDLTSLTPLLLRKKVIDLISDASDITRLSGIAINWMSQQNNNIDFQSTGDSERESSSQEINLECDQVSFKIFTFDGFPLTLHQQCRIIPISANQNGEIIKEVLTCDYFLQFFELDVNLNELEALINYRQRLSTMQGKLSIEDYLKQELSLMFEDVEYSVHSQNFVEKYYSDKMASLFLLQRQKQEKIFSNKQEEKQRCSFKTIKK